MDATLKLIKTIEKYDKLIEDYYKKSIKNVFPILDKKRKKYDFIFEKLQSFYFVTNYISAYSGMKTGNVEDNALFTIFNKAALDLFGIFYCLYNGLEIQAGIIYRSLYEIYVYNDFIFKEDTKNRIKLFFNFQFVERWNHIQESLQYNPNYIKEMKLSDEKIAQFKEEYDLFKNDYNIKRPHHWAYKIFENTLKGRNPSLFDICKNLGDDYVKEYISVYGTSSKQTHPSSIIGDYFTSSEKDNMISINSPMYKDSLVNLGVMSICYCGYIILEIIKYFKIKNLDEISTYIRRFIDVTVEEGISYVGH